MTPAEQAAGLSMVHSLRTTANVALMLCGADERCADAFEMMSEHLNALAERLDVLMRGAAFDDIATAA